jgi:putative tryptophan/tyrosine transport system substrate-binding protein
MGGPLDGRLKFLALGGDSAARPVREGHLAKQATIGFLGATTPSVWRAFVERFETGLRQRGWIDGANVVIDYEWAEGEPKQFGRIAKKFAKRGVDVIVTSGTGPVQAAIAAAGDIPIVYAAAGDPKNTGLLTKGKGTVVGFSNRQTDLAIHRLDKLHKLVPRLDDLGILGNGGVKNVNLEMDKLVARAKQFKIRTQVADVRKVSEIAPKIKAMKGKVDALFVCTDPFVTTHHIAINIAAAAAGLPTIHAFREYVEGGGLASYGPDFREMFDGAADLVDQILRGARGDDIKVKAIKVGQDDQIIINRSTAKALGVKIPKGIKATMIG